jgi:DNA-binding transcriptional ArsR family regulator
MVNYQEVELSRAFAALADPTRRALLTRLAGQPDLSVSELAAPFRIKLPAITKHLNVLSDAGLVTRTKVGRTVYCRLRPRSLQPAARWLAGTEAFWARSLDNLESVLEARRGRR